MILTPIEVGQSMRTYLAVVVTMGALAGLASAQEQTIIPDPMPLVVMDPWDGAGPPAMGTITGEGDGDTITWTTYDFSVGAFDASAWATRDNEGRGPERLSILGYTTSDSKTGRILIRAGVPGYQTGTYLAEVLLVDADLDAPRVMGMVTMEVTTFRQDRDRDAYGDFRARASGTLCSVPDPANCFPATFVIDTRLQYGF